MTRKEGERLAATWADYIRLDLEHYPMDFSGLKNFMEGLLLSNVAKEHLPAVVAELPFPGLDSDVVKSNAWIARQILNLGVDGLLLCHAEDPEAVLELIRQTRYPVAKEHIDTFGVGLRGHGGEKLASNFHGITPTQYIEHADYHGLSENGQLVLGIKMENLNAYKKCNEITKLPGISFAEWGLGDMSLCCGYLSRPPFPLPKDLETIRRTIWKSCLQNDIPFLGVLDENNYAQDFEDGMKIFRTYNQEIVELMRKQFA